MKALVFALTLLAPLFAHATPFEKHFGNYEVLTSPENIADGSCPFSKATISYVPAQQKNEYGGIVMEARGERRENGSVSCEVVYRAGFSVDGHPEVKCIEEEDEIVCSKGTDSLTTSMTEQDAGVWLLQFVSSDNPKPQHEWNLRRLTN